MSQVSRDDLFRQAAEAEGGASVSAGVHIFHLRTAEEKGRAIYVDLTTVPEEKRTAVILQIKELVQRESVNSPTGDAAPAS